MQRPCDGLISRPRRPTVYKNEISELMNADWAKAKGTNPGRQKKKKN
jgi:hypothetical protein